MVLAPELNFYEPNMATTVKANGQITIPKSMRLLLGFVPGSKVDFRRIPDGMRSDRVCRQRAEQLRAIARSRRKRPRYGCGHGTGAG